MESSNYLAASGSHNRSCFQRYKWLIIISTTLVVIAGVVCGVLFGAVFPNNAAASLKGKEGSGDKGSSDSSGTDKHDEKDIKEDIDWSKVKMNDFNKPDLSKLPTDLGSFKGYQDNQANSYSVKLGEPFPYDKKKIRGVNLGGWLVPEPFIVPSLFMKHKDNEIFDEWTLCTKLGKEKCQEELTNHYNTFVTEKEIKLLADSGLNHVRIPFGYWSIETNDDEPFVYGAWKYLLRGIQWCRKYGIRVNLDFHSAPGSQNGWNHSGRQGEIHFLNSKADDSAKNVERFIKIVEQVAAYFNKPEWRDVVTQIGVLNEPNVIVTKENDLVDKFNKETYSRIRKATNATKDTDLDPILYYHDGFVGMDSWASKFPKSSYKRVGLDGHYYLAFAPDVYKLPYSKYGDIACDSWYGTYDKLGKDFGIVIAGEFSGAMNDCGIYLNGIGNGARYEGKMDGAAKACDTCTCDTFIKYKDFTDDYKKGLKKFIEAQMDSFERGTGWYYWNFKIEGNVNPSWDYLLGVKEGWIPKDAGDRDFKCKS